MALRLVTPWGRLVRDGTGAAIEAACSAVDTGDDLATFVRNVRAAVAPYDQREGHTSDDEPLELAVSGDLGRPSRAASIEELPVALAALKYGAGDGLSSEISVGDARVRFDGENVVIE
jgi:hypothetical protein